MLSDMTGDLAPRIEGEPAPALDKKAPKFNFRKHQTPGLLLERNANPGTCRGPPQIEKCETGIVRKENRPC